MECRRSGSSSGGLSDSSVCVAPHGALHPIYILAVWPYWFFRCAVEPLLNEWGDGAPWLLFSSHFRIYILNPTSHTVTSRH